MTTDKFFNAAVADRNLGAALNHLNAAVRQVGFRKFEEAGGGEKSRVRKATTPGANPTFSTLVDIADTLGFQIALIPKPKSPPRD